MKKILVSACLLGIGCRYNGKKLPNLDIGTLSEKAQLIPVCPEIYGGLPTPREPSERVGDRVLTASGADVTLQFQNGAYAALEFARMLGCEIALLKNLSPSCGVDKIYDGTFSGQVIDGSGYTADLLRQNGIHIYSDEALDTLLADL